MTTHLLNAVVTFLHCTCTHLTIADLLSFLMISKYIDMATASNENKIVWPISRTSILKMEKKCMENGSANVETLEREEMVGQI